MSIPEIAAFVATALVPIMPYIGKAGEEIAKKFGNEVWDKGKALYQAIKKKFQSDDKSKQTLKLFEEDPETFKTAIEKILIQKLSEDGDFQADVQKLVEQIQKSEKSIQQLAVGNYIAQASDHSTATVQINESKKQ
ncbi:hypothetical protein JW887_04055 [Candidatus Dojkabacteria bacterium]|nr:hypothetical protein [Candidatus Dojkabacteria bacterium]